MKKSWIVLLVLLAGAVLYGISMYNSIIRKEGEAQKAWANVESSYQRRADLIPNLVSTVKGAADFERETLNDVINARAKATSINIDPSNITPEQMAQFQQAQGELSSALSRLLVTVERYPDLKANQNFLNLQDQLEGTENRINVERNRFNEAAMAYNVFIREFPKNLFANMFGFTGMGLFESEPGSEKAPDVQFDF